MRGETCPSLACPGPRRWYRASAPVWVVTAMLLAGRASHGAITTVGPFHGTYSESFDHLGKTGAQQQLTIFGSNATVMNLTSGGALKLEYSSSLDGDLVTPRSPPLMMGQIGISQWIFQNPVSEFGGYFQNNSRFDDATVAFYDVSDQLIGSVIATDPKGTSTWTWNGWQSDVPIHRMVITGNDVGFLNGFIWFDDVQMVPTVPEPSPLAMLIVAGLVMLVGHRRAAPACANFADPWNHSGFC